ncbi:hypothetical protein IJX73_01015 [bacterium]|nr:hypothetical protein [bacterium]
MNKIDKIFKYTALINTSCILLPLLSIILSLSFIQVSEKISQNFFYLAFFILLFGNFIYLITFIMIFVTFIVSLFKKNKTKKDYIIIFFKFIYIIILILFAIMGLLFYFTL